MANLTSGLSKLNSSFHHTQKRRPWPAVVIYMSDEERDPDPLDTIKRLPKDAWVIFRHYDIADRQRVARQVAALCRRRGLKLLVAGDGRLAAAVQAQGLHLPEHQLRRFGRRQRQRHWIVTAAAHSPSALLRAQRCGVDIALVSPVFVTASHPGGRALGPLKLARFCCDALLPVVALGGITPANCRRVQPSGAIGIAAISMFR